MIRRLATTGCFVGLTLVVTLVLVELGSRLLFPQWAPVTGDRGFWEYDPALGWAHRPGESGQFEGLDFSVTISINEDGLRDSSYARARTPGTQRMLVLGDSFGWGFGVEQHEVFSEIIERRRAGWEIINASVSGYGTDQEYLYYLYAGAGYAPDIVLLLFYENDLENAYTSEQYWHGKPRFFVRDGRLELTNSPVPKPTATQRLAGYVSRNTYFLAFASRSIADYIRRARDGPDGASPDPSPSADPRRQKPTGREGLVIRLLVELDRETRERGARLVVVSIPGDYRVFDLPEFLGTGIPHLSLSEAMRSAGQPTELPHDNHWSVHGHRVAAAAIERFLEREGVFAPRASAARGVARDPE